MTWDTKPRHLAQLDLGHVVYGRGPQDGTGVEVLLEPNFVAVACEAYDMLKGDGEGDVPLGLCEVTVLHNPAFYVDLAWGVLEEEVLGRHVNLDLGATVVQLSARLRLALVDLVLVECQAFLGVQHSNHVYVYL